MAIQFNPNALSIFSSANFGNEDAIANLGGKDNLVQKDELGCFLWRPFRSGDTRDRNNAVRTELLKALGQAFNLEGVSEQGDRTTFSDAFMQRLSDLLGPAFKRGDFGIENGEVKSGKPLTQRRITAIFKAAATAKAETPYDAKTYLAKVDSINDVLRTKDPNAQAAIAGYYYVKAIKRTIAFLESDMDGFDEACRNPNKLEHIKDWVGGKCQMYIYPEEITAYLDKAEPATDPYDPDDGWPVRRAQIKTYIRNRLEEMVKNTVDICLEAMKAGKLDDCMKVASDSANIVSYIERDMAEFKKTKLGQGQEIQE